jgi:hypothetical protein
MAEAQVEAYFDRMTTLTASRPASFRITAVVAAVVLVAFGAFSLWVTAGYGFTGFISLAAREPWALQILIDLAIACSFALGWLIKDARKRGLAAWPYVVATLLVGSFGLLAYAVRRAFVAR